MQINSIGPNFNTGKINFESRKEYPAKMNQHMCEGDKCEFSTDSQKINPWKTKYMALLMSLAVIGAGTQSCSEAEANSSAFAYAYAKGQCVCNPESDPTIKIIDDAVNDSLTYYAKELGLDLDNEFITGAKANHEWFGQERETAINPKLTSARCVDEKKNYFEIDSHTYEGKVKDVMENSTYDVKTIYQTKEGKGTEARVDLKGSTAHHNMLTSGKKDGEYILRIRNPYTLKDEGYYKKGYKPNEIQEVRFLPNGEEYEMRISNIDVKADKFPTNYKKY